MIELFQQYGLAYLFSDGAGLSGVAMTLWLFIISVLFGFFLSIPLALARVSEHFWLRWPVEVYTYLFRGTPLYIQLLICYTGLYSLEVVQDNALLNQFFRNALNCTTPAPTPWKSSPGRSATFPMAKSKRHAPMACMAGG
jgi:histidine transport system permease protein